MDDNTRLNPGSGGDLARTIWKGASKTQVVVIDKGGAGPESLVTDKFPIIAETLPLPAGAATEVTLEAARVLLNAVRIAVEALNGKATTINTANIGGTVALDAATLAALENIVVTGEVAVAPGTTASIGGSITAGGTAQNLVAANAGRHGLTLQNTSTGELRVNPWGTASASAGFRVAPDQLLVLNAPHCGTGVVSIWGATTGQTFQGGDAV